jgi:isoaspartyl peptidase/L-asparaginase-like protein (Ntn-hydrolase superfamily)
MTEPTPNETPQAHEPATPLQRILMDRARQHAERDRAKAPRSPVQIALSVVLALAAVFVIGYAFNAFLSTMQRAMHVMDEQEKAQQAAREAARQKAPIPAYVVPAEEKPAAATEPAPATSEPR